MLDAGVRGVDASVSDGTRADRIWANGTATDPHRVARQLRRALGNTAQVTVRGNGVWVIVLRGVQRTAEVADQLIREARSLGERTLSTRQVNPVLMQAVGHFLEDWGESEAPLVINPWQHGVDVGNFDPYPAWQRFIERHGWRIDAALRHGAHPEFWRSLEQDAEPILRHYRQA